MSEKTIFFVVGRLGDSLVYQKIMPFIKCDCFDRIFVFKENQGIYMEGVAYVLLPFWLRKLRPKFIKRFTRLIYEPIQLLKYAIRYKPDYINGIYTLPKGFNSVIVSILTGSKSIVSVIGANVEIDTYKRSKIIWRNLNIWMLKKADIVTTTGSKVSKYIIDIGIDKNKVFEFTGGIDTDVFYENKKVNKDIDILFVGSFTELKGPDRVIDMIFNICNDFPKIKAHFLGDGYLFNNIEEKIKSLELEKNIILNGYINKPEKYFQKSKLLIMPSRSEGLSMAMLEAMACGCVPVVSDVGNMTDAAQTHINSYVVDDYKDITAFVKCISILLNDKYKRETLSKNAVSSVADNYSIEAQTKIAHQIIEFGNP